MKIGDVLQQSGIAKSDAELLIAHVLEKTRSFVLAHHDVEIDAASLAVLRTLIERRKKHEPIALIIEQKEFYGRMFCVTKHTLIPRPATEAIVVDALAFLKGETPKTHDIDSDISSYCQRFQDQPIEAVLDIGTGSGCIGITLSCEGIQIPIVAVDTSDMAIKIAIENAKTLGAPNVQFTRGDGITVVRNFHRPFLLVSNPPYIPAGTPLEPDVADFEPHSALFAGKEGLDIILPLLIAAKGNANCVGVVMEMRTEQTKMLSKAL